MIDYLLISEDLYEIMEQDMPNMFKNYINDFYRLTGKYSVIRYDKPVRKITDDDITMMKNHGGEYLDAINKDPNNNAVFCVWDVANTICDKEFDIKVKRMVLKRFIDKGGAVKIGSVYTKDVNTMQMMVGIIQKNILHQEY